MDDACVQASVAMKSGAQQGKRLCSAEHKRTLLSPRLVRTAGEAGTSPIHMDADCAFVILDANGLLTCCMRV
jgi:hypothetical protein